MPKISNLTSRFTLRLLTSLTSHIAHGWVVSEILRFSEQMREIVLHREIFERCQMREIRSYARKMGAGYMHREGRSP
jgi:hypothetical protein